MHGRCGDCRCNLPFGTDRARSIGLPDREPLGPGLIAAGRLPDWPSNPSSRVVCKAVHISLKSRPVGQFMRRVHGGVESNSRGQELHQRPVVLSRLAYSTFGVSFPFDSQNNSIELHRMLAPLYPEPLGCLRRAKTFF